MTQEEFLLKDYELKITYLTDHFQRIWTRFNFFVTIETALIGGNFLLQAEDGFDPRLVYAGIVLSIFWYLMGAEDRYLMRLYRYQAEKGGEAIADGDALVRTISALDYFYLMDAAMRLRRA